MKLYLKRNFFAEKEHLLAEEGELRATAFRFSTGVEALKIENSRGYFVILPFQGQQLWDFHFADRDLKMVTTIKEPRPTGDFLETYGGFLYHCGVLCMGVPDDKHPHHGELPNHPFDEAYLEIGCDETGSYIAVGGSVTNRVAFTHAYRFSPRCRLDSGATTVTVDVKVENLRSDPMEYMYLCHINFRPMDGARLIDSVPRDKEHIKVHRVIPESLPETSKQALRSYMDELENDPTVMDKVGAEGQYYLPEICFTLRYATDRDHRGYTLQYLPGKGGCYVSHPTDVLPYGIRWISRTSHEDAMGMVLPATAEHLGYDYAKEQGQIKYLDANSSVSFSLKLGFLTEKEVKPILFKIESLLREEAVSKSIERKKQATNK